MTHIRKALVELVTASYDIEPGHVDRWKEALYQAEATLAAPVPQLELASSDPEGHRQAQADHEAKLAAKYESTYGAIQDGLLAEVAQLRQRISNAEHWAKHAMLMRSTQNTELLRILAGEKP